MEYLLSLSMYQWSLTIIAGIVLGVSKSGLKGISAIVVTLLALAFETKNSTGVLLPLLIVADIMAVIYYRKFVNWVHLFKIIPWIIIGIIVGAIIGDQLPESLFKKLMAGIIFISIGMMLYVERKKDKAFSNHIAFSGSMGLITGFVTMVGNLAGPFSNIYFLALRLPKNFFIGTAAWLFLFVNVFKFPLHYFWWKTIDKKSLTLNLVIIPFLIIGFIIGIKVVDRIKELHYRQFIIIMTILGALLIFIK